MTGRKGERSDSPTLQFLRSKLFVALVAFLVFGGYAETVFGMCEAQCEAQHEQGCSGDGGDAAHHEEECQCLCHQTVTSVPASTPLTMVMGAVLTSVTPRLDFAPDGVPAAIDHPPQLA